MTEKECVPKEKEISFDIQIRIYIKALIDHFELVKEVKEGRSWKYERRYDEYCKKLHEDLCKFAKAYPNKEIITFSVIKSTYDGDILEEALMVRWDETWNKYTILKTCLGQSSDTVSSMFSRTLVKP